MMAAWLTSRRHQRLSATASVAALFVCAGAAKRTRTAFAATSPWPGPRRPTRTSDRSSTRFRHAMVEPMSLGMLSAVGTAVLRFMETHDLVKKGTEIKREDIREGLTAVLATACVSRSFRARPRAG